MEEVIRMPLRKLNSPHVELFFYPWVLSTLPANKEAGHRVRHLGLRTRAVQMAQEGHPPWPLAVLIPERCAPGIVSSSDGVF